ncbi:MAG: septum formation initiator family protein [Verrucomicrobiae bacterium]|nr:septum formation initiator family protein [Verrucomicrobiae bacterium]MDW8310738.1 septum formation initiator family protein [Verrucomicrobiales bacterium]
MAKNRRHQSAAIRFGPALKALLLCALLGGSGVGYVWQKGQINELGQQILKRERALAQLQEQNKKLRDQLALLRSPAMLEARARELNLGLVAPRPQQIVTLLEPRPEATAGAAVGMSALARNDVSEPPLREMR